MAEDEAFWEFYWEVKLQALQDLGKRAAILAASRLIRQRMSQAGQEVRLLELGCGEGQIIGPLVEAHAQAAGIQRSVGIDYKRQSIEKCRRDYPGMRFIEGDFTDQSLLAGLGQFQMVLLVNALHEVFSAGFSEALQEVDVPAAKQNVRQALQAAAECLQPGGQVVLFDGLEPAGDPFQVVRLRLRGPEAKRLFESFAGEYHPFRIQYQPAPGDPYLIELRRRDFTRYITKSIFLGKRLWATERYESYQYFTESEFRTAFAGAGLQIDELRTLTVDEEKWRSTVEIETPGVDFPDEHILILAHKLAA